MYELRQLNYLTCLYIWYIILKVFLYIRNELIVYIYPHKSV